jgi:DNA-binding MarR family transcriptional regulator
MNGERLLEQEIEEVARRALKVAAAFPGSDKQAIETSISFNRTVLTFQQTGSEALTVPGMPSMTQTRFELLSALHFAASRRLSHGEIARALNMGVSNVTRLVGVLEQDRLVERVQSASDKRVSYVHLTPAGEEALLVFTPRIISLMESGLRGFSSEERALLGSFLARLRTNLVEGRGD